MQNEKLVQSTLSFGGWTVDGGPQVWTEGGVWTQIEEGLAKSNVPQAAGTLRRYLEFTSTILADNLRARIEYHGGQYDLGGPSVLAAWKARLQEARFCCLMGQEYPGCRNASGRVQETRRCDEVRRMDD
ncbi:hypothetical protein ACVW1C_005792 [Bradyrhizobium sp. USDA 4011]